MLRNLCDKCTEANFTGFYDNVIHLSSSSPRGGTLGCRWGNWGLCRDLEAYLCPYGGGNEGPLLYHAPDHREIWGLSFR